MIMTKYEQTKKYDVAGNVETFGSQGIFSIEGEWHLCADRESLLQNLCLK